ncbi:WSC domain-containing protein 2 [Sciurus carolinensis]|uniref:WSC domain-containing protein 2 n=1 Tax=Sciurus carolinensis TaxID=30640 RepID=A0AA41ST46_SCICA|nr:WSC domain-containing protein 2 [Sciurus carolinensis]
MAKLWFKFQQYFHRKPVCFFTFLVLYLTTGSLVFLHSGFMGQSTIFQGQASPARGGPAQVNELPFFGNLHLARGFREGEASSIACRHGTSLKGNDANERAKLDDYGGTWSRALKGRVLQGNEEEQAKYICCYLDDTQRRALRGVSFFHYKNMTIFRCQDNCAEWGYLYTRLEFSPECYFSHKIQGANMSVAQCVMECKGEQGSVWGSANCLSIYQLQLVQQSACRCIWKCGIPRMFPQTSEPLPGLACDSRHAKHVGGQVCGSLHREDGSAVSRGCFHRPQNLSLALLVTAAMPNMSVDKCVDLCTEKEYPLAALAGTPCHCSFPTTWFLLHQREEEQLCMQKCSAEELESCRTPSHCRRPDAGPRVLVISDAFWNNCCMDRRFLPAKSKQLIALASFPGTGNTWACHHIEVATGFYTGSYYFNSSLYN